MDQSHSTMLRNNAAMPPAARVVLAGLIVLVGALAPTPAEAFMPLKRAQPGAAAEGMAVQAAAPGMALEQARHPGGAERRFLPITPDRRVSSPFMATRITRQAPPEWRGIAPQISTETAAETTTVPARPETSARRSAGPAPAASSLDELLAGMR